MAPAADPSLLLLTQREIHVDLRNHIHRFAVEQRRFVNPLLHGVRCRGNQQRVTADQRQVLDGAVLTDDGVKSMKNPAKNMAGFEFRASAQARVGLSVPTKAIIFMLLDCEQCA